MRKSLVSDPLFVGLTRPAMIGGVPQPFFVVNAMVSMTAFLLGHSFVPLLVGAPLLHLAGCALTRKDLRTFDIWFTRARFLRCRNRRYWGANSYDPLL